MKKGDQAPDFKIFSDAARPFHLSKQLESGPVVLLFFPAAFTGVCTTELNTVNMDLEAYGGATVVGVSTDAPFTLAEYKKVNGLTFPLLSDHDADVSLAYGCKYIDGFTFMKLSRISKRAAFVVASDGMIAYAEILENAGDQPDLDAIKSTISIL